jgi:GT2 family glycosyltransferase
LITVKNSVGTIDKCIDSVLNSVYTKKEIFVVDAYSTDGTYELLKKYNKKIKLFRIGGNAPKAFNFAIKKIDTDLIAFTDADCVVDKHWLKHLVSGFTSKDIVASAGFCSTPKNVNRLQKLIGMELEERFKHFPKFIPRAPTMNLCVKTEIVKKVRFDERFDVAFETDFGYRLTKLGKMIYIPRAVIYHYHRPTLKSFFKQQFNYGKLMPLLYFKHRKKVKGDHISKPTMILQESVFIFACLFAIISAFKISLGIVAVSLFTFLFILYFVDIICLTKNLLNIILFYFLYLLRTVAWTVGLFYGLISLIKR